MIDWLTQNGADLTVLFGALAIVAVLAGLVMAGMVVRANRRAHRATHRYGELREKLLAVRAERAAQQISLEDHADIVVGAEDSIDQGLLLAEEGLHDSARFSYLNALSALARSRRTLHAQLSKRSAESAFTSFAGLLDAMRRAGLRVQPTESGTRFALVPGAQNAIVTVVREAVQRVILSGGRNTMVRVGLEWGETSVTVSVLAGGPGVDQRQGREPLGGLAATTGSTAVVTMQTASVQTSDPELIAFQGERLARIAAVVSSYDGIVTEYSVAGITAVFPDVAAEAGTQPNT